LITGFEDFIRPLDATAGDQPPIGICQLYKGIYCIYSVLVLFALSYRE
jgi:hypothetical protein